MKRLNLILILIGLAILMTISGCSKHSYGIPVQNDQVASDSGGIGTIEAPPSPETPIPSRPPVLNNQIDILLMVDFSLSMLEFRQQFADQTGEIINQLNKMGIDYHIAIMPINIDNNFGFLSEYLGQISYFDKKNVKIVESIERILSDNNLENHLFKRGLDAMKIALSSSTAADGKLSGFLRENAFLNIVVLTGDNDYSAEKISHYKNFLNTLRPPRENGANAWKLSYLGTVTKSSDCIEFKSEGLRYIEMAKQSNGNIDNICRANWNKVSLKFGNTNADLITNYHFETRPDPEKIIVTINGKNIIQDPANGWSLIEDINTMGSKIYYLHFNGESIPDVYSEIKVDIKL